MPQTRAGKKVLSSLEKEYPGKGKQIYYALQVEGKGGKGKHRWEGAKPGGTLAKARRTYARNHKKKRKVLTYKERKHLGKSQFAIPSKREGGKGGYPIPDKAHARNALARVAQFGTAAQKAQVEAKVHAKFPDIGKKKHKGFEGSALDRKVDRITGYKEGSKKDEELDKVLAKKRKKGFDARKFDRVRRKVFGLK